MVLAKTFCPWCGAELPPWFDDVPLYDVEKDNAAYERWLDTKCLACGRTPREVVPDPAHKMRGSGHTEH
jgi:hypothetical protein